MIIIFPTSPSLSSSLPSAIALDARAGDEASREEERLGEVVEAIGVILLSFLSFPSSISFVSLDLLLLLVLFLSPSFFFFV